MFVSWELKLINYVPIIIGIRITNAELLGNRLNGNIVVRKTIGDQNVLEIDLIGN